MDRRNFLNILTSAGVAAGVAAATSKSSVSSPSSDKDIAERILDTRQMNCGYIPFAPVMTKDPNTGKLGGLFFDMTERLGELINLEIKWNTETTYATFAEDLEIKKYDVFGGGIWANASRAKVANFSMPVFYSGVGLYVRKGDTRFDGDVQKLNNPQYRIVTIDGEMSQIIQQSDFEKASVLGLPNTSDIALLVENVLSKKADATFIDTAAAQFYMRKYPGALSSPVDAKPLRIFENTWAFSYGSSRLKGMIDAGIKEMLYSGFVDHVLSKHGYKEGYYPVKSPV